MRVSACVFTNENETWSLVTRSITLVANKSSVILWFKSLPQYYRKYIILISECHLCSHNIGRKVTYGREIATTPFVLFTFFFVRFFPLLSNLFHHNCNGNCVYGESRRNHSWNNTPFHWLILIDRILKWTKESNY